MDVQWLYFRKDESGDRDGQRSGWGMGTCTRIRIATLCIISWLEYFSWMLSFCFSFSRLRPSGGVVKRVA